MLNRQSKRLARYQCSRHLLSAGLSLAPGTRNLRQQLLHPRRCSRHQRPLRRPKRTTQRPALLRPLARDRGQPLLGKARYYRRRWLQRHLRLRRIFLLFPRPHQCMWRPRAVIGIRLHASMWSPWTTRQNSPKATMTRQAELSPHQWHQLAELQQRTSPVLLQDPPTVRALRTRAYLV